jgi:hypothetical protein
MRDTPERCDSEYDDISHRLAAWVQTSSDQAKDSA